eukprot:scaffold37800_cov34-Cyclotella_meneghiniana.AAC.1
MLCARFILKYYPGVAEKTLAAFVPRPRLNRNNKILLKEKLLRRKSTLLLQQRMLNGLPALSRQNRSNLLPMPIQSTRMHRTTTSMNSAQIQTTAWGILYQMTQTIKLIPNRRAAVPHTFSAIAHKEVNTIKRFFAFANFLKMKWRRNMFVSGKSVCCLSN